MVVLLAKLDFQLLNFVVVEILLDQVALPLYSRPHIGGDIWNQPGHEVLDHKNNVLWRRTPQLVKVQIFLHIWCKHWIYFLTFSRGAASSMSQTAMMQPVDCLLQYPDEGELSQWENNEGKVASSSSLNERIQIVNRKRQIRQNLQQKCPYMRFENLIW